MTEKKTKLKESPEPVVFGVDVTANGVSIARLVESETPKVRYVTAPSSQAKSHSVASTVHRQESTTAEVMGLLLKGDVKPSLVVMGKLSWGLVESDPSFPRRDGQWWSIVRELVDARVPVAEVPLSAVQTWALGKSAGSNTVAIQRLSDDLVGKWDGLRESVERAGEAFRPSAVGYAAMGAMTLGVATPYAPTDERVRSLTMRRAWKAGERGSRTTPGWTKSYTVQWPEAVRNAEGGMMTTAREWAATREKLLARYPSLKGAA